MPYVARQAILDAGFAAHGLQRYWKSGFDNKLSNELIEVLVEGATNFPSPMSAIACYPIHGAVIRVAPDATAYALREALWDVSAVAQWLDPGESQRHIAWARQLWARIDPHTTGTAYPNHMAGDEKPERIRASYGKNYERLVALKNKYDPANFFRVNPNIKPMV
jgi:FAD/FMN-containing dehydrogenase